MPKTRPMGALFAATTGEIKTAPASWQDVFFPLIGSLKGS